MSVYKVKFFGSQNINSGASETPLLGRTRHSQVSCHQGVGAITLGESSQVAQLGYALEVWKTVL